jgi:nitrogen fixation NifU-like protein
MQLDDLYRRVIMDHYKSPHNSGTFDDDAITVEMNNPTCGDTISLQLMVKDGIIERAKFKGEGCSISIASASMMTDAVKGKKFEEALQIAQDFSSMMTGSDAEFEYEDIQALSGVTKFPARIKCATLSWNAMKKGIELSENKQ